MAPFITCEVRDCLALLTSVSTQWKGNKHPKKRRGLSEARKRRSIQVIWAILQTKHRFGTPLLFEWGGVDKLWLLRGPLVSAYLAPVTQSSHATSRSPAGLCELTVAGRALEDNITGLLCQVAEWLAGFLGRKVVFPTSVDVSRFRSD